MNIRDRYLQLLSSSLTGLLDQDDPIDFWSGGKYDPNLRHFGRDWPGKAKTMIGVLRMRNLRQLCEEVIKNDIPGDLCEAGVWRGGACIYMRGILEAWEERTRKVFVADSFKGLPPPNAKDYPVDAGDVQHTYKKIAVPKNEVIENFFNYNLMDDRVVFIEGWFKDTLPTAPIDTLSVLRLDCDMYESTTQVLENLYPKLSVGGYCIIDDYNLPPCVKATEDYREERDITTEIHQIDGHGVYWQKEE